MTCSFVQRISRIARVVPSLTAQSAHQYPVAFTPVFSRLPSVIQFAFYNDTMSKGKEFVDAKIAGSKVVVFSKSYCPYCQMAKKALNKYKINSLDIIEIEDRSDCEAIQDYLLKLTGGRSVPRVFIKGKFIGGGSETTAYDREGKLEGMLKEAEAL